MPTPILHTEGVCKSFGDHVALAPLDVDVQQGRIVGLLGPNGAGKTTLLRMVTGITKPDAGTLRMWGRPHHRSLLSRMGYLPEERGLYKSMRVAEQVLYFAGLRGMDRQEAERELKGWFERLEVEGWWNREVSDLSKGMAQKIQFIATVLHRPELLILDEPFSGIDPIAIYEVQKILRRLKERGLGILITDHNVRETLKLVDRAYIIHQGQVLSEGSAEFLAEDPKAREVYLGPEFNL